MTSIFASQAAADGLPTVGSVERLHPDIDALISPNATIKVLAKGFKWSEGPVWIPDGDGGLPSQSLLFSDIPNNRIHCWNSQSGLSVFLEPAGFTGPASYGKERGSNGLALDTEGRLLCCEHGVLVRNMHRWGAHLMVLSTFLHMARVFYHGAYKAPREFNWIVGVMLLKLTLLLSFTGYLLPWDQLSLWAVTVGTNMMGFTPVFGDQVRFVLLGGKQIGAETLLRWYVLHVLMLPFVLVIFLAIHFWRVRKDGGISGPL